MADRRGGKITGVLEANTGSRSASGREGFIGVLRDSLWPTPVCQSSRVTGNSDNDLLRPLAGGVQDSDDLNGFIRNRVNDQKRRSSDYQFPGMGDAARPSLAGEVAQASDMTKDRLGDFRRRSWVVLFNVSAEVFQVFDSGRRPDDGHPGGRPSSDVPHRESQSATSS